MSLTFDEAAEQLRLAIPENFVSPTMHDITVMAETQIKVSNELRKEYAPTVEMTQAEVNELKNLTIKAKDAFSEDEIKEIVDITPDTILFDVGDGYFTKQSMQAWLYPECVKVVE